MPVNADTHILSVVCSFCLLKPAQNLESAFRVSDRRDLRQTPGTAII